MGQLPCVAEPDVCLAVGWQRPVVVLGVVHILPAHEVGMPNGLHVGIVEIDESVEDG